MSPSSNVGGEERPTSRTERRTEDSGPGAKPDYFYGDRSKVDDWINQMRIHHYFKGTKEREKTMVAITYLRGRAQHWMKPEVTNFLKNPGGSDPNGMMMNFEVFVQQLKMIFGASEDAETNASVRIIQSLRQKGSASDYTSRFKEHMVLTGWDDEALRTMYRRGLKENVKDEMMRSGASMSSLNSMINEAIRIDDMLYERTMEKRHVFGKTTGYSPRGRTGEGFGRGDPMEIDVTVKGRQKRGKGKGKGNKKTGIKCYSCGQIGHMKKDCRKNKVQRQFNTMQVTTPKPHETNQGRGGYDMTGLRDDKPKPRQVNTIQTKPTETSREKAEQEVRRFASRVNSITWAQRQFQQACDERTPGITDEHVQAIREQAMNVRDQQMDAQEILLNQQEKALEQQRKDLEEKAKKEAERRSHDSLSWTGCYDDSCLVHLSDKQGSGWFPTKPRRQLNMVLRKPLQQLRDKGNARHLRSPPLQREDATLQENQEPQEEEAPLGTTTHPWRAPDVGRRSELARWFQDQQPIESYESEPSEPSDLDLGEPAIPTWEERVEQANILAATQSDPGPQPISEPEEDELEEEPMIEDSEDEETYDANEKYTWTIEGPPQLHKMTTLMANNFNAAFPKVENERCLHPVYFDMLIDKLRAMFWNHDIVDVEYDYAKFIVERPPVGSVFSNDGSYTTPDNHKITRNMRNTVLDARRIYHKIQERYKEYDLKDKRDQQLGVILDCDTSEESENE